MFRSAFLPTATTPRSVSPYSAAVSDVGPARFGVANATLRTVMQVFYGVGTSVVITLLASQAGLGGYQRAWVWVSATMALSAALVVATFPTGSSSSRRAAAPR